MKSSEIRIFHTFRFTYDLNVFFLPIYTIFHYFHSIKNGVFRYYGGPRGKDDFIDFIENKKWTVIEPIPRWKYPDNILYFIIF